MPFRELSPSDKVERSQDLSLVLHKISVDASLFDEDGAPVKGIVVSQILNELRRIYSDGYRQRYSDLLKMLNSISRNDSAYRDDLLSSNLERIMEQFRKNAEDEDYFLALYKLTDHIALEIQRNRDYRNLMMRMTDLGNSADAKMKALNAELEKAHKEIEGARKEIEEAHKEAQRSKMETVAILSIFAAIVIAFAGGLDIFGGTISASEGNIFDVAFAILLCGLMFFNIVAFLMYMVLAVIRLHDPPREVEGKGWFARYVTSQTGGLFVFWFDVLLMIAMLAVVVLKYIL